MLCRFTLFVSVGPLYACIPAANRQVANFSGEQPAIIADSRAIRSCGRRQSLIFVLRPLRPFRRRNHRLSSMYTVRLNVKTATAKFSVESF